MLGGIERLYVQSDRPSPEQRAGACGEVLQPRANRQNDIGRRRRSICRRRTGHADGAEVQWMTVRQATLTRLGFHDRNAMLFRERG